MTFVPAFTVSVSAASTQTHIDLSVDNTHVTLEFAQTNNYNWYWRTNISPNAYELISGNVTISGTLNDLVRIPGSGISPACSLTVNSTLTIGVIGHIYIGGGTFPGMLVNNGTITNNGRIQMDTGSSLITNNNTIVNNGTIDGNGTFTNNSGSSYSGNPPSGPTVNAQTPSAPSLNSATPDDTRGY